LGVLITMGASVLLARRKSTLDDARRFDADIVEIYLQFDAATGVVHENAGGNPEEERKVFWAARTARNSIGQQTRTHRLYRGLEYC
jgi:hypothetical protein